MSALIRRATLAAALLAGCATPNGSRTEESRTMAPSASTGDVAPTGKGPSTSPPAPVAVTNDSPGGTVIKPPESPHPIPFRPLATPGPLTFVTQPVPNKPIVSFRLVFHSGSIDDPKGKEGLTELTARILNEGGTRSLTSAELLQALFPMAAELSAHVDKEFTVFEGRVHKDHLERFFQIFSDTLLAARFDPKEFDRLRADQLNAIKNHLRGEDDETLGKEGLDSLLYPAHPYGHPVIGTVAGVNSLTLDDVKAQAARIFTQDRLVVGLAGAVDKALEAKVRARLAMLPMTGAPLPTLPPAPGIRQKALLLQKDALSTAVSIGESIDVRRGDPDWFPLAFAVSYLGEHRQFTGVLMNELREKRGLNYGDYAYPEHFHQEGYGTFPAVNVGRSEQDFSIWLRPTEPANAHFAARGALYFLRQLVEHGVAPDRFDVIRGFLLGYTRLWEQTDQRRLGYAIDDLFYGTHGYLDSYRKALGSLTAEQVQAAVKRHLDPDALDFVFVAKDAEQLARRIAAQEASPMSYPTPKPAEVTELDKQFTQLPLPIHPKTIEVQPAATFMER